jgi:hypothetical protein
VPDQLLSDKAEQALRQIEDNQKFHDDLVNAADHRWKSFEGILDQTKDAAQWRSQLHPPYVNHIVETTVAGLMDDRFSFRITPAPRFYNPGEFDRVLRGARAHSDLFRVQLKNNRFNEFQRPYVLDAAVVGMGVAKTFWMNDVAPKKRLVVKDVRQVNGMYANLPVAVPVLVEEERVETVFDGWVTESVDLRDMYWHEAAVSAEKSRWIAHEIWMSYPDLQKLAKAGKYDQKAVDDLSPDAQEGYGPKTETELRREARGRNKDMHSVIEFYNRETSELIVIGDRKVELRPSNRKWPFWHRCYPFTFSSLQPYPRSLRGMSIVEKLAHLQEAAWDLMNQRIDNLRFINNFISILPNDVDDPDAFPYEPGAQWFVDDPSKPQQWQPNQIPAEISLGAESIIKQDMQNLAGGQPFTSTSEANQINANTATEAALVTNLAQAAIKQMKTQLYYSYERIGCQAMYLNQQFIREPVYLLDQIGIDTQAEVTEILPYLLQGEYMFDVEPMAESLNRQERRSEASSLYQVMASTQAVSAASGAAWNMKQGQRDLLEAYDKQNPDVYLSAAQPQGAPGGQPNPALAAPPQQAPTGVTAQQSIDPAVSPSTQASLSPAVFQQRNLSMNGGVSNAA